jgi:hypothetical protein
MYGLPEDFDGRFLVGKRVELVCFSENQVVLNFDADISIVVESSFSFRSKPNVNERTSDVPVMESNLMELLGHKVFAVTVIGQRTLCVSFDNGSIFKCYDDTTQYESYKIRNGESVIIV